MSFAPLLGIANNIAVLSVSQPQSYAETRLRAVGLGLTVKYLAGLGLRVFTTTRLHKR